MRNIFRQLVKLYKVYSGQRRHEFMMNELIFFVTYKCNFRCKTCFYAEIMDKQAGKPPEELDIEEIAKISLSIGRLDNLLISGGEPFLRTDLPQICRTFYLENSVGHIHIPTNGFDPQRIYGYTREILQECPGIYLDISLPLDGLEETHDKIKGVRGSFLKVVETTKTLSALKDEFANFNIYIITVVNSLNQGEILELAEFVKNKLPVSGHGPSPLRGQPYDTAMRPPSWKEWEELAQKLMPYHRYWIEKGMTSKFKASLAANRVRYVYGIYREVLKGKKLPFRCQAGNVIGVLEPNGDVKLCELTQAVGNLRLAGYDFRKVWFSPKADQMRKAIKGCACAHACFLSPSIKLDPLAFVRSYL